MSGCLRAALALVAAVLLIPATPAAAAPMVDASLYASLESEVAPGLCAGLDVDAVDSPSRPADGVLALGVIDRLDGALLEQKIEMAPEAPEEAGCSFLVGRHMDGVLLGQVSVARRRLHLEAVFNSSARSVGVHVL